MTATRRATELPQTAAASEKCGTRKRQRKPEAIVRVVNDSTTKLRAERRLYHACTATPKPKTKEVIEVIRSEDLSFPVMDRLVTKVVVESAEDNVLLGRREGYLIATVRQYYRIDLNSLSEDAVQKTDGTIYVTLREPKELDFSVDLDSARFLSKRSGLIVPRDFLGDLNFQQELEPQLHHPAQQMRYPRSFSVGLRLDQLFLEVHV
jgi:hypothetical protein